MAKAVISRLWNTPCLALLIVCIWHQIKQYEKLYPLSQRCTGCVGLINSGVYLNRRQKQWKNGKAFSLRMNVHNAKCRKQIKCLLLPSFFKKSGFINLFWKNNKHSVYTYSDLSTPLLLLIYFLYYFISFWYYVFIISQAVYIYKLPLWPARDFCIKISNKSIS